LGLAIVSPFDITGWPWVGSVFLTPGPRVDFPVFAFVTPDWVWFAALARVVSVVVSRGCELLGLIGCGTAPRVSGCMAPPGAGAAAGAAPGAVSTAFRSEPALQPATTNINAVALTKRLIVPSHHLQPPT
jgi:hypothetical protein